MQIISGIDPVTQLLEQERDSIGKCHNPPEEGKEPENKLFAMLMTLRSSIVLFVNNSKNFPAVTS